VSAGVQLVAAYDRCEAVTREQAANFFYGIRLLPRERRRAMCAAYAFARRVDDIGDGGLEHAQKLRLLNAETAALGAVESGRAPVSLQSDPVMVALADTYARFSLPPGALGELIAGVRMDVEGVSYETFEELVLYCRRVAGAIGRVCLAIFARRERRGAGEVLDAEALADDLGVALQLTNILRDVREDAENGRVYLPLADLRRFGLIAPGEEARAPELLAAIAAAGGGSALATAGGGGLGAGGPDARPLAQLVRFEAERAREWFDRGIQLAPELDRRSAACVLAMAGIYRRVLDRIEDDPEQAVRSRVSLPGREKAWVAARVMLGGRA
jgi:15-cis-phytoene synthase